MTVLLVIENPEQCPIDFRGASPVAARSYLSETAGTPLPRARIINICRSYRYQGLGYYVSLLAEARGHKPLPTTTTIQDMKTPGIIRLASDEMEELIAKTFGTDLKGFGKATMNVYFGKTPDAGREALARRLFQFFPAPFIRATFVRQGQWSLSDVSPISATEVPEQDRELAAEAAREFITRKRPAAAQWSTSRYDLAILVDPAEKHPPSNSAALRRFIRAADKLGIGTESIQAEDTRRLSEFDGLFIRETTRVDHHTYRMARKAAADGLVVIDDPLSILRCSNKVYLAELLSRHKVPVPQTLVVHSKNAAAVLSKMTLPCILKQPESSFSQGVVLADSEKSLECELERLLKLSELVIIQEFVPTVFDWRIGILEGKPLFACRYYMAKGHWAIIEHRPGGKFVEGNADTIPTDQVPEKVMKAALKAAAAIGDGLYGVDLKQTRNKVMVVEVNDNPNIDHGVEDAVLGDELYTRIMEVFLRRMQKVTEGEKAK